MTNYTEITINRKEEYFIFLILEAPAIVGFEFSQKVNDPFLAGLAAGFGITILLAVITAYLMSGEKVKVKVEK